MKTAVKSLAFAFALALTSSASFATSVAQPLSIEVVSTKYSNLFVFKVDRKFKGAMVEIYYSDGDLVASAPLSKRKMIINFCDVKPGTYTIKVIKNNKTQEFEYVRK